MSRRAANQPSRTALVCCCAHQDHDQEDANERELSSAGECVFENRADRDRLAPDTVPCLAAISGQQGGYVERLCSVAALHFRIRRPLEVLLMALLSRVGLSAKMALRLRCK